MPSDVQSAKAEIRAALRARRDAMAPEEARWHGAAICEAVCALPLFVEAGALCAYMAIGNEAPTEEIILHALARGMRVALPRTVAEERRLALHQVTDLAALRPGPFGIPEPPADAAGVAPEEIDLFLVPGVAFDAAGNRLGFGAGYYDRLLQGVRGRRVALAHALQLVPRVPATGSDVPVEFIVTEAGVIDCARGRRAGDRLRLRNMIFHGHHGAFPQEREQGIRLAIDVELRLDLQTPGLTDDLHVTVDYPAVYRLIQRIQSGREFALFETLAEQIARAILHEFPLVEEVTVHARKFHPPVGGLMDAFEVEVTRSRAV